MVMTADQPSVSRMTNIVRLIIGIAGSVVVITFIVLSITNTIRPSDGKATSMKLTLSPDVQERLKSLRQFSVDSGLPQKNLDVEVCYDEGCLDAAHDILSNMNASVDPCHDFFQFTCGGWIAKNEIPASTVAWAQMSALTQHVRNVTLEILREPVATSDPIPLNQAKQFFKGCMDSEAIEKVGLAPLKKAINNMGGWQLLNPKIFNASSFDWLKVVADTMRMTTQGTIFSVLVQPHLKNSDRQVIYIDQPTPLYTGFGVPRAYLIDRALYPHVFSAYETYIYQVAKALNSTQNEQQLRNVAKEIIAFEESLAKLTKSDEGRYEKERLYNPRKLKDFQTETDKVSKSFKVSWSNFLKHVFQAAGIKDIGDNEDLIVQEVEYVKNAIRFIAEEEKKGKQTLANYVVWRFVAGSVDYTTKAMQNITFQFKKAMYGLSEPTKQETTCANAAGAFGMAISAKFIQREFNEKSKDEVNEMVVNLKEAFGEMISEADWMKHETKEKAIEKKAEMLTLMAYPEWIKDKSALEKHYEGLNLSGGYMEDLLMLTAYFYDKSFRALRQPTNRRDWVFPPNTVNAYHFFNLNTMVFPAGFLHPPYFGGNRPKHQNYGGIGAVIGHEVTHGFDKQGAQYNKNGSFENWWDDETKQEYERRGYCMSEQYSKYCYNLDNNVTHCINGNFTLGENIGDNGGIRESYRAYKKFVERNGQEKRLPGLESFSTEQLFFMGWGNIWCEKYTQRGLVLQLLTDPHSPGEWRVNGAVRNSVDFAKAYNCPINSNGMNPPAAEKCVLW